MMGEAEYNRRPTAMLIADPGHVALAQEALDIAGLRLLQQSDWADAAAKGGQPLAVDLIVIEASAVDPDVLEDALPSLDHHAQARGARIVASFDVGQIDAITAHLFGRHVQLLCAPDMADRVAALSLAAGIRLDAHVAEIGHDGEAARLRRLNEEVARIAETLARLTRDDGGMPDRPVPSVGDRRGGYSAPPAANAVSAQDLRQVIRTRRMRSQFFEPALFEDPAWDMLLDLYAAELERAQVSVSSLCIAAAVAPTTALRWIAKMTEAGLLERHPDPFDRRRAFMALSAKAREALLGYFAAAPRRAVDRLSAVRLASVRHCRLWRGRGRLAQLVERLVYTENVGGSSPSSPTTPGRNREPGNLVSADRVQPLLAPLQDRRLLRGCLAQLPPFRPCFESIGGAHARGQSGTARAS